MKILWFSNTPCSASAQLLGKSYSKGGWLNALQGELVKNVDISLSVAFYWPKPLAPFAADGTRYYPVLRSGGRRPLQRIMGRFLGWNNQKAELERLMEVVRQVAPDLVHIHGTEENYGLIQRQLEVPVVISLQGILSVIALKYFSGIPFSVLRHSDVLRARLKAATIGRHYKGIAQGALRERQILAMTRFVAGRTLWDQQVSRLLAPRSWYFEIQELLRPSFFDQVWSKKTFGRPLRVVSTLGPGVYKGLETLVQALVVLKEARGMEVEWRVAGLTATHPLCRTVARWLKVDLAELPLSFLGSLDEKSLSALLLDSDLYCQTSHIENSPNSLCEAMLVGLPCIASFVGGTSSILEHEQEGWLVQDGDPYALAAAVTALGNDFERAAGMGRAARKRALQRHDPLCVVETVRKMYADVLNSGA